MSDQWKAKYLDALDEQEQLESRLEVLRRGMVRLSLLADGLDHALDQELSALREHLRSQSLSNPKVMEHLDKVDDQYGRFEKRRARAVKASGSSLIGGLEKLQSLAIPKDQAEEVQACKESLSHLSQPLIQLPELIPDLVTLQWKIIQGLNSGGADSERLQVSERLQTIVMDLIQKLDLPDSFKDKSQELQDLLSNELSWGQLDQLLTSVIDLVLWVITEEKSDFEDYLLQLNQRLLNFEKIIQDVDQATHSYNNLHDAFQKSVRDGVQALKGGIKDVADIDVLKSVVQGQLDRLIDAADQFKQNKSQTEAELKAQLEALQGEMQTLKSENSSMAETIQQQKQKATTDPLTQLPNREAWNKRVSQELARLRRYQTPVSMAVADVDFFKQVNDSYGHLAGDKVLKVLAKTIAAEIREMDFIARYGGEEFVILLPQTNLDDAIQAIEKVRVKVESCNFQFEGKPVPITMSFGVAQYDADEASKDTFKKADAALYRAKNNGRNRVESAD